MRFLGLISVFLTFTLALSAPHKRQAESPEYVLQLINTLRQAHGVKTLSWNVDLEKASLAKAQLCSQETPAPSGLVSLNAKGASSWKEAINKIYTMGLSQYDFNNPNPQRNTDVIFMLLMAPRYKSVGCATTNCSGTDVHQCLFEFEGVQYQSAEEFVNDVKANVHPANATLLIDSVAPKPVFANLNSPQPYGAYISF
ncbi:uncharacterized protein VTP21DRAFT_7760 [Calcarisporiella thermophila]|uniref:uncharacterized protein n=1 Tax=Calcarisporiella thermophila TaxID=911321 RepID=UPI003743EA50